MTRPAGSPGDTATDLLVHLMDQERAVAQRSEDRRIWLAIASLTVGLVAAVPLATIGFRRRALPITFGMTVTGLCGAAASKKLHEREQFHASRARLLRRQLGQRSPDAQVEQVHAIAARDHQALHRLLSRVRLNDVLVAAQLAVAGLGLLWSAFALRSGRP